MLESSPLPAAIPGPCLLLLPLAQEPQSAPDTPTVPNQPTGGTVQPPGPNAPGPGGPCAMDGNMLFFLGLAMALMYFMAIRPENRRRKEQQAMLAAVKVGDRVVTLGGMHGEVAALDEKTVTLRVDATRMTFDRTAITRVVRDEAPTTGRKG